MDINEFVKQQLQRQAFHVNKQLERLAEKRGTTVDDLASLMIWHSGFAEDTVLRLTRGRTPKLPGTVLTLMNMVNGINCDVKLTVFPIDDDDRTCLGTETFRDRDKRAASGQIADFLCRLRMTVQHNRNCSLPPSSLEEGIHSQTIEGFMRAMAVLGYKVRIYLVTRSTNTAQ